MANYSLLYSSRDSGPPDQDRDRLIASGRYMVPAFWIASCTPGDLCHFIDEDDGLQRSCLSLPASKALAQFEANRAALEIISPEIADYYDEWCGILRDLGDSYLKIDPNEIIFMTDQDDSKFRAALGFFEEIDASTADGLLAYTCLTDILDRDDPKRLGEYAIVLDEVTQSTPRDYLIGIVDRAHAQAVDRAAESD